MGARQKGPALIYIDSAGKPHQIDTEAVPDERERAICRALSQRADRLADRADQADPPPVRTGLYL